MVTKSTKIKTYIDTDVIINLFKEESNRSKHAITFIFICLNNSKIIILTSDIMFNEIYGVIKKQNLDVPEQNIFYNLLKNCKNIIKITASKEEIELSEKYGGLNQKDLLHFILAKNHDADYLVSNNIRHMELVKTIYTNKINKYKKDIKVLKPIEYINLININVKK